MHIDEALGRFLVQLVADGRSRHTRDQYNRHLRVLASFFREHELGEIGHEDIARFFGSKRVTHLGDRTPKKAATLNALRSSVRGFFKYAHGAGYTRTDPSRLLRRARTGRAPPRALSAEDERRFFETLDAATGFEAERDQVLFRAMRETGIRLACALAITTADVDLDAGMVVLRRTKGDRTEHAYLPAMTAARLAAWIARRGKGLLFPSRQGGPMSPRQAQRRFAMWAGRGGCPEGASPHALRHGFASRLYERTGDLLLVREALGHRSVTSTVVYAAVSRKRLREALSMDT